MGSKGMGQYWKPIYGLIDIVSGKHWSESATFKYGGTGGSIWDTNIWLLDSQLLRPAKDLAVWAKIDDLWASYVIDALLGWEMRSLNPSTVPIDIGDFREKKTYYHILSRKVSARTEKELMDLHLPAKQSILSVSTWSDPAVDKEGMFTKLQTTFGWDIDIVQPKKVPL